MRRLVAAAMLMGVAGCAALQTGPATTAAPGRRVADRVEWLFPERIDRGYVLMLTGVAGYCSTDRGITMGLKKADVDAAVEIYDWTDGSGGRVRNLHATDEHRRQAQCVAARICAYQDQFPGQPVHVVGYSGGASIAIYTLESLPPGRTVTSTTLLAAVLAPDYDLSPAMQHSLTPIRHFHSQWDAAALMVTTTVLGTMEGRRCWSAGAVGFCPPQGLSEAQRAWYASRLVQQKYDAHMLFDVGHLGGHYGWANPWFIARWVAPGLKRD